MSNQHSAPIYAFRCYPGLPTKRQNQQKLTDIILLPICAVLSGQDDWKAINLYGRSRLDFLKRFGNFSHGMPTT